MTRPTLVEQLAASRRRERYLLALFAGTWAGHLLAAHSTAYGLAFVLLFLLAVAGIFLAWQVINLFLDSRRFRKPSSSHSAPTSVKPESQPAESSLRAPSAGPTWDETCGVCGDKRDSHLEGRGACARCDCTGFCFFVYGRHDASELTSRGSVNLVADVVWRKE